MKKIIKPGGREMIILNLTDIHMDDHKLSPDGIFLTILNRTLDTLVARVRPDLITVTGDIAWGGYHKGQAHLIHKLDSFEIPWAPVLGNHDHETDETEIAKFEDMMTKSRFCLYEPGDPSLGHGNYTLLIEDAEAGQPALGLIFLDSHDRIEIVNEKGETVRSWARLWEEQLTWYREQVRAFRAIGCERTAIFQHIPSYGYKEAFAAAFRSDLDREAMPLPDGRSDAWNPGYEDSRGVSYENVCCAKKPDNVFATIAAEHSTTHIFCGHEHINNWRITYQGVRLVYTLKTGCGAYWHPALNGGTVITVGTDGIRSVEHSYVKISQHLSDRTYHNREYNFPKR